MTCIVGLVDDGTVYIGGDSAGTNGYLDQTIRVDQKVWVDDPYIYGFTTSYRMGQLLRYSLTPPEQLRSEDDFEFLASRYVDSVRKCLKDGGFATAEDGREAGGTFLVGYRGRLFQISSDYQVGESSDRYAAVGCGYAYALGSLHATDGNPPEERVQAALEAAEKFSAGVMRPFIIERLEQPNG